MQALTLRLVFLMLWRPVRRSIESMLSPCCAMILVAAAICSAVSVLPIRVRM